MKNTTGLFIIIVLLLAGAWFLFSINTEHDHEHPHDHDHPHEAHGIEAKEPVRADGTFSIVTSFYPLAFALETLTDRVAEVTNIGAGRDPHDVQLSTADVLAMQQADLVVLQGADLEPWGDTMIDQLKREAVPVLLATHGLPLHEGGHDHHDHHDDEHAEEGHHHDEAAGHEDDHHHDDEEHGHEHEAEHSHGAFDPHTWLDPTLFSQSIGEMIEALETLDPENASLYEERGAALQAELAAIDTEYTARLATCALDEVIVSHDAFGYLGERYGFSIHAIAGLSTQDLPSAQTLAALKAEAEEGIGAILLEENSVAAYGETLAQETGLRTLSINPIAYAIPEGEDYLSIMRTNLAVFADALQCE